MEKKFLKLGFKHYSAMTQISKKGDLIWDYGKAEQLKEIQRFNQEFLQFTYNIESIRQMTGIKFKGTEPLPYFYVKIAPEGKKFISHYVSKGAIEELSFLSVAYQYDKDSLQELFDMVFNGVTEVK